MPADIGLIPQAYQAYHAGVLNHSNRKRLQLALLQFSEKYHRFDAHIMIIQDKFENLDTYAFSWTHRDHPSLLGVAYGVNQSQHEVTPMAL